MPNLQNFRIKTDLGQRCKRCPGRCQQNHYSLDREYRELKVAISNIQKHKEPIECFKHSTVIYHPPHNCNKIKCTRCGSWGYSKEKPVVFYETYSNYNIGKLRCDKCYENSINNKRPPIPDTDEGNKKPKFEIPEPEDPMVEMDLDPPKPNKGKGKQKYTEIKYTNCNKVESPINCINELGINYKCDEKRERLERTGSTFYIKTCTVCQLQTDDFESRSSEAIEKLQIWMDKFGYDLEDEDDKSEEQDKINKMSERIQKYLNKEFKGRIFSEYPKEKIKKALDSIIPQK
ncbi:22314_t:CDS:2 [Rhizophagus irregularis]|nr:22314_t:CDS:2 [Rhizophagus irregularis]